ncbi:MAG: hypothetical protein ACYDCH_08035 [Gaiellaceae bacterium]
MSAPGTVAELAAEVRQQIGYPVDADAVAATIETLGIREVDARERFGESDVFALAQRVRRVVEDTAAPPRRSAAPGALQRVLGGAGRFASFYGRGIFFALPMIVQVLTITLLRLGVLVHLSDAQATVVMLGSILSFIATGGFVQAIGRLGSVYVGRESYRLARLLTYRILGLGLVASAAVGFVALALGAVFQLIPSGRLAIGVVYDLVLSTLWLFLAVLYMLQRRALVLACVMVWVGSFALLLLYTSIGVYASQWLSAGLGALLSALLGALSMRQLVRKAPPERGLEELPPIGKLLRETAPFFWYGILYFAFVFLDRIVGWTKAPPPHYAIFFHRAYELGLDWALLTLLLTVALLDYTINAFAQRLVPTQERFAADGIALHNQSFQRFYARQLALLFVLVVVSAVGIYLGGIRLRDATSATEVQDFFGASTTYRVYMWAALGYGLLVWGLLNVIFFFYLSRPAFAVRSLAPAIATGAIVGLAFSRGGSSWQSVIGLAAGGLVFAATSTAYAIRIFDDMAYYYYSAY